MLRYRNNYSTEDSFCLKLKGVRHDLRGMSQHLWHSFVSKQGSHRPRWGNIVYTGKTPWQPSLYLRKYSLCWGNYMAAIQHVGETCFKPTYTHLVAWQCQKHSQFRDISIRHHCREQIYKFQNGFPFECFSAFANFHAIRLPEHS